MFSKSRLLLSLLLFAAFSVSATTVPPVDVATMVDQADLIFVGTVIGSESVPTADGSYAYTYVTFDVEQTLKGIARGGKVLTIRIAGGEAGDNVFEVAGAPKFAAGQQHLLFVKGNDRRAVPFVGWFQGKLDIVPNPMSRQPILVDHARNAVDGIEGKAWKRGGLKLNRDGSLKAPRGAAATVVSQEGVRIELEKPEQAVEHAAPVESVLAELRAFIASRRSSPSFRNTQFTDSASKANVPASFVLKHGRAK